MECSISSTLCRLCLHCDDSASCIFEASDQYVIASLLRELLHFHVSENDGYPKMVCSSCVKTITDFKKYKEECLEAMSTYDTEIRLHKSRSIHQEYQDVKISRKGYRKSYLKRLPNADDMDAFGNILNKEGRCSSEDKMVASPILRPDDIKQESEVSQDPLSIGDEENDDKAPLSLKTTILMKSCEDMPSIGKDVHTAVIKEEVVCEVDPFAHKFEDYDDEGSESNSVQCSVPGANYQFIRKEDVSGASTSVNLEEFNETEESVLMHERNAGKKPKRNVRRGNSEEDSSSDRLERKNQGSKRKCYVCDICGKVASTKQYIAYHVRVHSGARPHKCKVCNKSFSNPSNLKGHENIHKGIKSFECKSCHKTFTLHSNLVKHEERHLSLKNYPCDQCLKTFVTRDNLQRHQQIHKQERRFSCTECGKGFLTKSNLMVHMRVHSGLKPFTCQVCNASFTQNIGLKRHSIIHMEVKPFTCLDCKRYFLTSGELQNHECIGNKEYEYSCCKCGFKFAGLKSLRGHEAHCKKR